MEASLLLVGGKVHHCRVTVFWFAFRLTDATPLLTLVTLSSTTSLSTKIERTPVILAEVK